MSLGYAVGTPTPPGRQTGRRVGANQPPGRWLEPVPASGRASKVRWRVRSHAHCPWFPGRVASAPPPLRVSRLMIVDGYVRVSQVGDREGESFISPLVQRDQIEGWAKLHGAVVDEVFVELDESGARSDRPLLMRA